MARKPLIELDAPGLVEPGGNSCNDGIAARSPLQLQLEEAERRRQLTTANAGLASLRSQTRKPTVLFLCDERPGEKLSAEDVASWCRIPVQTVRSKAANAKGRNQGTFKVRGRVFRRLDCEKVKP